MQAARGPNALNIMAYMEGEEEEQEEVEEGVSSRPNIDVKVIEDQFDNFVEEMQKYDKILSDVAKNIEDIDGEKEFITDFYPKFIWQSTYEEEQEKKIVANTDPELAKIIQQLERNNRFLKDDMRAWVMEFAKTAKLTQVLIGENKVLRQSISKKNKEIVKLIDTIGQADTEDIAELIDNLQLLQEENGVLKQHLVRLKEEVGDRGQQEARIEKALQEVAEQHQLLEKQKAEAEDQEEHLSKTLELIEQWGAEAEKRRRRLQKEKQYLSARHQEYEEEKDKIERELQLCSKERKELESGPKKEYLDQEAEKYRLMQQIHQYGDLIARYKSETRYFEEQTVKNTDKKQEYQQLCRDYSKKVEEAQAKLAQVSSEFQAAQEKEVTISCQIDLQQYDISVLKTELEELEEKERKAQEEWKTNAKRGEEVRARELGQWKDKVSQSQRQLSMKIFQERSELGTKQKELERWEQKIYQKKEELSDLKSQMKEIKDNQNRLAELKAKLHAQNK